MNLALNLTIEKLSRFVLASALVAVAWLAVSPATADETCMSPYMAKIVGQEDFVYVWTLGSPGVGDEQDKLVTVDVNPDSGSYGKVVASLSVGGRNEAHHSGLTDDRRFLWASGLDTSKIFVFDIHSDPAKPKLTKKIHDFVARSGGVVGPHTNYALPGRMMLTGLSNAKDHGGRTGIVEYTNAGEYITTHWMPTDDNLQGAVKSGKVADGYGYDVEGAAQGTHGGLPYVFTLGVEPDQPPLLEQHRAGAVEGRACAVHVVHAESAFPPHLAAGGLQTPHRAKHVGH